MYSFARLAKGINQNALRRATPMAQESTRTTKTIGSVRKAKAVPINIANQTKVVSPFCLKSFRQPRLLQNFIRSMAALRTRHCNSFSCFTIIPSLMAAFAALNLCKTRRCQNFRKIVVEILSARSGDRKCAMQFDVKQKRPLHTWHIGF
jgi:hypothetical protein